MNTGTWWITKEKRHLPETKKWYCRSCEKLTIIERNPDWNGEYTGIKPAPAWFTRCNDCKKEHWQTSYGCDNCGWDELPEWDGDEKPKELIEMSKAYPVMTMEYSNCFDWEETWKCPYCKNIFTFTNGNC